MADVICSKCGEPWELDTLHEEVSARYPEMPWFQPEKPEGFSYQDSQGNWQNQKVYEIYFNTVRRDFQSRGCEALYSLGNVSHNAETLNPAKYGIMGAIMEMNGSDIDAAIGDMADAEMYGLLDD